jgi:hypothetical protein
MRPSSTTATGEGRHRISALVAALIPIILLLALVQPAAVLAKPPTGTVTVTDGTTGHQTIVDGEPEVCTFVITFDFDQAFPIVGWKIKDWVPGNWKDGKTHLKGQGATDGDGVMRIPDTGSFSLPDGRYNVVADDEWPIDGSSKVQSFHVVCPQSSEPTPTPTPTPTPPDEAGEQPVSAAPAETSEVGAATGKPRTTLPPTDGGILDPLTSSGDSWFAIVGLGVFAFVIVLVTPRHLRRRR